MAEIRGALGNFVGFREINIDSAFVGNSRKVEHRVGGAAKRHVQHQGIFECLAGHDVAGKDIVADKIHDAHTGLLREADTLGHDCRNRTVSRKRNTEHFRHTVHRIRGEHTGTRTAGRTGFIHKTAEFFRGHLPRVERTDRLKDGRDRNLMPLEVAAEHRAAGNNNRRNVDAGRCHHETRNILIAGRHHHETVKRMGDGHGFRRVRNQLAGNERVLHTLVAHRETVAYSDGREDERHTARKGNALLHGIHNIVQVHVPRNDIVLRADDADQRTIDFFISKAEGLHECKPRSGGGALGHLVTAHMFLHFFFFGRLPAHGRVGSLTVINLSSANCHFSIVYIFRHCEWHKKGKHKKISRML